VYKGQIIVGEGATGRELYLALEGLVEVANYDDMTILTVCADY